MYIREQRQKETDFAFKGERTEDGIEAIIIMERWVIGVTGHVDPGNQRQKSVPGFILFFFILRKVTMYKGLITDRVSLILNDRSK